MALVIEEFNETNPFSIDKLNGIIKSLVGLVNTLAGEELAQYSPTGVPDGSGYAKLSGSEFAGQVSAPSMMIGPIGGPKYAVISKNNLADAGDPGLVELVALIEDLNQAIAGPSIAEVQAISDKVDELIAALKAAKVMSSV